jgi:hypothetical protein
MVVEGVQGSVHEDIALGSIESQDGVERSVPTCDDCDWATDPLCAVPVSQIAAVAKRLEFNEELIKRWFAGCLQIYKQNNRLLWISIEDAFWLIIVPTSVLAIKHALEASGTSGPGFLPLHQGDYGQ